MSYSGVSLWTATCQAPLSMEFSRQEDWGGFVVPSSWRLLLSLLRGPSIRGSNDIKDHFILVFVCVCLFMCVFFGPFSFSEPSFLNTYTHSTDKVQSCWEPKQGSDLAHIGKPQGKFEK